MVKRIIPLVLALMLCGCSKEPAPTNALQTEPIPTQTSVAPEQTVASAPTEVAMPDIAVDTPCGTLYLPDIWDEPIGVECELGEPMILTFYAGEIRLYALTFSTVAQDAVGVVRTEDGSIFVGMELYELEEPTNRLLSMQETLNDLMAQLQPEPIPDSGAQELQEDICIETAYGVLHFPMQWEELLHTEQLTEDMLIFSSAMPGKKPVELFVVNFGSEDGDITAKITGPDGTRRSIAITISTLLFVDDWTQEEMNAVYAMQEDLNYLLEKLAE